MSVRRRGIRLKALSPDDPGIQELLDSDFCLTEDPDDPEVMEEPSAGPPPMSEVGRELLEGLHATLAVLQGEQPRTAPLPASPDPDEKP